jgi:orotidine-5'-phosphate decarboxylase
MIQNLVKQIRSKKSFICVGLDPDLDKIPNDFLELEDPIFEFNKFIIDQTNDLVVAYKPNLAFYECHGLKGWQSLEKTINYINDSYPDIFTIADAKRGDIGNTSEKYAKCFFEELNFDSITVNPYMGKDSVEPFLKYKNKITILLTLTSNEGKNDFQLLEPGEKPLYQWVFEKSKTWINSENLMYVVGATSPEFIKDIRENIPDNFFLVPGVGAQGGDLDEICKNGLNENVGLLINSSRGIIYSDDVRSSTLDLKNKIQKYLE